MCLQSGAGGEPLGSAAPRGEGGTRGQPQLPASALPSFIPSRFEGGTDLSLGARFTDEDVAALFFPGVCRGLLFTCSGWEAGMSPRGVFPTLPSHLPAMAVHFPGSERPRLARRQKQSKVRGLPSFAHPGSSSRAGRRSPGSLLPCAAHKITWRHRALPQGTSPAAGGGQIPAKHPWASRIGELGWDTPEPSSIPSSGDLLN